MLEFGGALAFVQAPKRRRTIAKNLGGAMLGNMSSGPNTGTSSLAHLLASKAASLPIAGEQDLELLLRRRFKMFFQEAAKFLHASLGPGDLIPSLDDSDSLARSLLAALGHWLDGRPEKAISEFDGALDGFVDDIRVLTSVDQFQRQERPFYRARVLAERERPDIGGMFHIPFSKRNRVGTQRYSFPGLPCLYLGSSAYVCWEELGRPEFNKMWFSRVEIAPAQSVRVVDFGYRPGLVAAGLDAYFAGRKGLFGYEPHRAAAYVRLWPLIAACSVKRPSSGPYSFVAEYVIPQLLLRWVISRGQEALLPKDKIDGIRYFSTHIEDPKASLLGFNYVFPTLERSEGEFCRHLSSKFHLTAPEEWQIATSVNPRRDTNANGTIEFALSPGRVERYLDTPFSICEGYLDRATAVPVRRPIASTNGVKKYRLRGRGNRGMRPPQP